MGLRPGAQSAKPLRQLGVLGPDDLGDPVAEMLRERGRCAAGRDRDRNRLLAVDGGQDERAELGHVCDVLAYALPLPLEMKQALLGEPHVDIRAEVMTQALKVSAARADRPFPPGFSAN